MGFYWLLPLERRSGSASTRASSASAVRSGYGVGGQPAYAVAPTYGNPAFGTAQYGAASSGVATAPPQYSPDGQWWWNGQAWTPVQGAGTPT